MKKLAERALAKLSQDGTKKRRAFGVFMKLLIADGSLVRLPDELERHYPSVWTNHMRASAKLHVIMNGTSRTPERVRLAPGSTHDLSLMTLEACGIGSLYVFDLAYYQGKLFRRIIERGGHFLCRVKRDANFRIVAADEARFVGQRHKSVLAANRPPRTAESRTVMSALERASAHGARRGVDGERLRRIARHRAARRVRARRAQVFEGPREAPASVEDDLVDVERRRALGDRRGRGRERAGDAARRSRR